MKTYKDLDLYKFGTEIRLVGAMYADEEDRVVYLIKLPGEDKESYVLRGLNVTQENWIEFLRQTDLVERKVFGFEKAIARKCQRMIDQKVSWAVYRRDNFECRYCGRNDVPLTVDHIDLWENGGCSTEDNLLSCCRGCNGKRGSMEYSDWMKSEKYRAINRSLTNAQKLDNINILNDIEYLKTKRRKTKRSR